MGRLRFQVRNYRRPAGGGPAQTDPNLSAADVVELLDLSG